MKSKIVYIVIAIVLVAVAAFLFGNSSQHTPIALKNIGSGEPKSSGGQFSGFSLKDYSGSVVNSAQFQGKPLVINAWASWCPFCRQELPGFVTAQKEFGDKVVIIAIDRAESLGVAKGYTDEQGTTNKLIFLLDPSDSFYQSIAGFSMPETIFVDKNGNIVDHKRGPMDINEIRQKIQKLLSP